MVVDDQGYHSPISIKTLHAFIKEVVLPFMATIGHRLHAKDKATKLLTNVAEHIVAYKDKENSTPNMFTDALLAAYDRWFQEADRDRTREKSTYLLEKLEEMFNDMNLTNDPRLQKRRATLDATLPEKIITTSTTHPPATQDSRVAWVWTAILTSTVWAIIWFVYHS